MNTRRHLTVILGFLSLFFAPPALAIGRGEYAEAVSRKGLGGAEKQTVIRAEIPGTVCCSGMSVPMLIDCFASASKICALNRLLILRTTLDWLKQP